MDTSTIDSARTALEAGTHRLSKASAQIARPEQFSTQATMGALSDALVELQQARLQTQAGVKILNTEQQTIGSFLDVLA